MTNTKEQKQIAKFRAKARELDANESETAFEAVVRKIAKTPSKKASESKKNTAK